MKKLIISALLGLCGTLPTITMAERSNLIEQEPSYQSSCDNKSIIDNELERQKLLGNPDASIPRSFFSDNFCMASITLNSKDISILPKEERVAFLKGNTMDYVYEMEGRYEEVINTIETTEEIVTFNRLFLERLSAAFTISPSLLEAGNNYAVSVFYEMAGNPSSTHLKLRGLTSHDAQSAFETDVFSAETRAANFAIYDAINYVFTGKYSDLEQFEINNFSTNDSDTSKGK